MKLGILFIVGLVIAVFEGCSTSPTGRKQLTLMPESQMGQMGAQAFQEMKTATPKETDPKINTYVQCVAKAVAVESKDQMDVKEWEVVVFKDATANAFALPGGKIGVHTGLLKVAVTPAQLAAVLGHEVGHVIARHGNERVSQGILAQTGMTAASISMKDSSMKGPILAALGLGTQFGVLLPYGRKQESEADLIGLDLMARAGFDPRESVELWKNMGKDGGKQPPQFMSTHPSHETRIGDLQANMGPALATYEKAKAAGKNPSCSTL